MKKFILTFLLTCVISLTFAQFLNTADSTWRIYRKQVYFGGGATQFLGDLGGKKYNKKRFGLADLDLAATRWEVHYGYRYQFHPLFATSTNLYFGKYRASDYFTIGNRRAGRQISIISTIVELSQRFEFIFYSSFKENTKEEKTTNKRLSAFVFTGIGLAYFNPQAGSDTRYEGTYLRPLSTEGQGYAGGAKPYKFYTLSIPFGFGVQKSFSRRRSIRFECSYMKTFSDYMDDTSGNYFSYASNDISGVSQEHIYFTNPSEDWNTFKNGDERGNPKKNDCYFFANISFVKAMGMRNKRIKKSEK